MRIERCKITLICSVILIALLILLLCFSHFVFRDVVVQSCFIKCIELITPIISVILIYMTYNEQRTTNKTIRFENTYWNLRKQIIKPSEHSYTEHIEMIGKEVERHFTSFHGSLHIDNFICLLNYYWKLHTSHSNLPISYFCSLKKIIVYIITCDLIETKKKDIYLSLLYDVFQPKEAFCFLCYLASDAYSMKDTTILKSIVSTMLLPDTYKENIKLYDSHSEIKLVECTYEEDYGYYEDKCKMENYKDTLERLNIK